MVWIEVRRVRVATSSSLVSASKLRVGPYGASSIRCSIYMKDEMRYCASVSIFNSGDGGRKDGTGSGVWLNGAEGRLTVVGTSSTLGGGSAEAP